MKGTEKQIKWANDIITNANKAWDDLSAEVKPEAKEKFLEMKAQFFAQMNSDRADVVIAHRMYFPEDAKHLKNNLAFFSKAKLV